MTEENAEKKKKQDINVSIDTARTEALARESERLKIENEKLKKDEPTLSDLIIQTTKKFGRGDLWMQATSKQMLSAMVENHINSTVKENEELKRGVPAGSPLVQQQYDSRPQDLFTKKFESDEQMIRELQDLKRAGNREAASYLDQMLQIWANHKRTTEARDQSAYNPNLPENLPPLKEVSGTSARTPVRVEQGDIQSILSRWRKERLHQMGVKTEGD